MRLKNPLYYYIKFTTNIPCDAVECKSLIIRALNTLFGEVGKSRPFDLLQYSSERRCGILRVSSKWTVELRAGLMIDSRFAVKQIASSPLSLVAHSRSYHHGSERQSRKRKRSSS